jgi:polyferredoxin
MIHAKEKPSFTGRMMAYSAVIVVLIGVLSFFIFSRSDMDITVMRSPGMLYQQQPGGYISNIYNAEIINKTNKSCNIILKSDDPAIKIKYIQAPGTISSGESVKIMFFVMVPSSQIHEADMDVHLQLLRDNKIIQNVTTSFVGPIND